VINTGKLRHTGVTYNGIRRKNILLAKMIRNLLMDKLRFHNWANGGFAPPPTE